LGGGFFWGFFGAAPSPADEAFAADTRALLRAHGATLLQVAAASIEHGLETGKPLAVRPAEYAPEIGAQGACFVTLERGGKLRGCIGSSTARRPLVADAAENGFSAAFKDPRFPRLKADEIDELDLSISVLGPPTAMTFTDETDFLRSLRPGRDGLIIEDRGRRALFLPSVWQALPTPVAFVQRLKKKAGLGGEHWSDTFKAWRFAALEMAAKEIDDGASLWRRHLG
jgi:AmmeMemoRadiSam system protein A